MGDLLRLSPWSGGLGPGKFFGPVLYRKCNLVIRVFFGVVVFSAREKDCSHTFYFSLIIVKSLQLRGRRKIAKPRKYCLVRVIVFFGVCFLYIFCFSQVGNLV